MALSPTVEQDRYEARDKPRPAADLVQFRPDPEPALSVAIHEQDRSSLPGLAVRAVEELPVSLPSAAEGHMNGVALFPKQAAPAPGFWADAGPHEPVGSAVHVSFEDAGTVERVEFMWVMVGDVAPDGRLAG